MFHIVSSCLCNTIIKYSELWKHWASDGWTSHFITIEHPKHRAAFFLLTNHYPIDPTKRLGNGNRSTDQRPGTWSHLGDNDHTMSFECFLMIIVTLRKETAQLRVIQFQAEGITSTGGVFCQSGRGGGLVGWSEVSFQIACHHLLPSMAVCDRRRWCMWSLLHSIEQRPESPFPTPQPAMLVQTREFTLLPRSSNISAIWPKDMWQKLS